MENYYMPYWMKSIHIDPYSSFECLWQVDLAARCPLYKVLLVKAILTTDVLRIAHLKIAHTRIAHLRIAHQVDDPKNIQLTRCPL